MKIPTAIFFCFLQSALAGSPLHALRCAMRPCFLCISVVHMVHVPDQLEDLCRVTVFVVIESDQLEELVVQLDSFSGHRRSMYADLR